MLPEWFCIAIATLETGVSGISGLPNSTSGMQEKKIASLALGLQNKKVLPSLSLWFAHWQWRVWPWLALAEAAESV